MTTKGATKPARKTTDIFKQAKTFSSFSVDDIDRAREFYGQTLGLKVTEQEEGLELDLPGGNIFLYPKPNHTAASFTVLNFTVKDIDEAVAALTELGLSLERYDQPDLKTDEQGIMRTPEMAVAWFKDPAGNILSVVQAS